MYKLVKPFLEDVLVKLFYMEYGQTEDTAYTYVMFCMANGYCAKCDKVRGCELVKLYGQLYYELSEDEIEWLVSKRRGDTE